MAGEKNKIKNKYDEIQKQINSLGLDKDVIGSMRAYVEKTLSTGETLDDSLGPVVKLLEQQFLLKQKWIELDNEEKKQNAKKQTNEKAQAKSRDAQKGKEAQPQEEKGFFAWLRSLGRKIKSWFTSSEKKNPQPQPQPKEEKKEVKPQEVQAENSKSDKAAETEKQISQKLDPKEKRKQEMGEKYYIETAGKKLDLSIQASSDVRELLGYESMIKKEYGEDSNEYKYISERSSAALKLNSLEKNKKIGDFTRPESTISENGVMLTKYHNAEKQTTPNGCWGAVLSNMLRCYNVDIKQEDVRAFRPEYNKPETKQGHNNIISLNKRLNGGNTNEILDVADIVHRTIPNAALHHISIATNEDVYGKNVIEQNKKLLKETVYNAIANDKAPVAMLVNSHYVTVTGIEDDYFIIENPNSTNDVTRVSVDRVFELCSKKGAVTIDWIEQLEFTQDGRCPKIEAEWAKKDQKIECKDGVFVPGEEAPYASHHRGNLYSDVSNIAVNGVEEHIYLPKMCYEKEPVKGVKFGETFKMAGNETYEKYCSNNPEVIPEEVKQPEQLKTDEMENEFGILN